MITVVIWKNTDTNAHIHTYAHDAMQRNLKKNAEKSITLYMKVCILTYIQVQGDSHK